MAKTITKPTAKIRKFCPRTCCWIVLVITGLATLATHYFSSPYQKRIIITWTEDQGVHLMFKPIAVENTWVTRRLTNDTRLYTKPDRNTTILLPQEFCHYPIDLLIITASTPEHISLRRAIRDTWGSYKNISKYTVRTYFLIGRTFDNDLQDKIKAEFKNYSDIIQEDFIDAKFNKTLKSLMILKIVTTYCSGKVKYLLKTGQDVYINIRRMENFVKTESSNMLVGHLMVRRMPVRDEALRSRYCPIWMYNDSYYPDHLYGYNYLMSADVVPKLYNASSYVPHFFIEGVYITGMLSEAIKLEPVGDEMFLFAYRAMDPCTMETVAISSGLNHKQIRLLHKRILETNRSNCNGIILISHDKVEFISSNGTAGDGRNHLQNVTIKFPSGQ